MGRKPTVNLSLPKQMRARRRGETTYYFYDTGGRPRKEIPLGTDYVLAVQEWAKLHKAPAVAVKNVTWLIGKYRQSPEFEALGAGTQADYNFALDKLNEDFGEAEIDLVRPPHVTLYLDKRSRESKHRALREVAVLGMLYRWAMARDYCPQNPVAPIKRKRLPGRKKVVISDAMLAAVYEAGDQALRDSIDLAYCIGQRPADVLKVADTDIKDGVLTVRQNKTDALVRIALQDEGGMVNQLGAVIERIRARKRGFPIVPLVLLVDERGKPMTKAKLRARFEAARAAAGIDGKDFQFRDLRRKAGSDLRDLAGVEAAQALLGHSSVVMTEHYTGGQGKKISAIPLKAPKIKASNS